ncbi:MAG: F0F1 ATP synthase subunit epsilon [Hyphomicrobiaceae bacterium]
MAGTFKFELVSPERILMSTEVEQVLVPGTEGDFTVLAGHAPVISTLRPGVIEVSLPGAKTQRLFVKRGFAEVDDNQLTVLAEKATDVAAMDAATLAAELKTAEAELAATHSDADKSASYAAVEQLKLLSGAKAA